MSAGMESSSRGNDHSPVEITRHPDQAGAFRLYSEVRLPAPLEEVFGFFADSHGLEKITPPSLGFRIASPQPVTIHEGARIDYRFRIKGLPVTWKSLIPVWEPPHRFVDELLRGPYKSWRHEHRFRAEGNMTVVEDEVVYRVPGGALIHSLFVKRDLLRIFEYRRDTLVATFGRAAGPGEREASPQGVSGAASWTEPESSPAGRIRMPNSRPVS